MPNSDHCEACGSPDPVPESGGRFCATCYPILLAACVADIREALESHPTLMLDENDRIIDRPHAQP